MPVCIWSPDGLEWPPQKEEGGTPLLVVLIGHGRGGNKRDTGATMAAEAAQGAGMVALTFDMPNHGARCADKAINADWGESRLYASTMYSQMLQCSRDCSTLLDVLPSFFGERFHDARYAIVGISLGARATLVHLVEDPRIKAAVLMAGTADYLRDFEMKFEDCGPLLRERWGPEVSFGDVFPEELRALVATKDPVYHPARFVGRKVLCLQGAGDKLVHWESMKPFVAEVNAMAPETIETVVDNEDYHMPPDARFQEWADLAAAFVRKHL